MTSPSLPPPAPLDLPEPMTYGRARPPSPLRNAVTADPDTGEISESGSEHDSTDQLQWADRVSSPPPSVAQFAANFAQRVGSLMSNKSSTHLPTDEELMAEAERERERTRREAERILTREAETKRLEDRVLAMLDSDMRNMAPPAPPALSSTPPSPSGSNKEGTSWLSAFKNKLTPTKEPLTPAQQIIQETKVRDKEMAKEEKKFEKEKKGVEKEMKKIVKKQAKQRSGDWPSSPEGKFNDPAFMNLNPPGQSSQAPVRQMTASPVSPSPARQFSLPPSLAPSPMRSTDNRSTSPGRNGPPLYAQFSPEGSLDMPATLLTIATRFEKLERWTVGHVRALEERMDDVERWLVDKEKEKESHGQSGSTAVAVHRTGEPATLEAAIGEVRDELAEVQGRIGELGREMAKMVTAPANLSSGPSRGSASIGRSPSASSSIALRTMSTSVSTAPRTSSPPKSAKDPSTSPVTTPGAPSRTRLPYPTGDYATPPDSVHLAQGAFSPPASPPDGSLIRRVSVSGLPSTSDYFASNGSSSAGLPARAISPPSLPPPPPQAELRSSVSPTPRKRYTVALGDSIMASDRGRNSRDMSSVPLSSSPVSMAASGDTTDEEDSMNDETIGKTAARRSGLTAARFNGDDSDRSSQPSPSPAPTRHGRARPVSMYSTPVSSMQNLVAPAPVRPLNTRMRSRSRSRSTDKFGSEASGSSVPPTPTSGRFVDPLITRRQTREIEASQAPPAPRVVAGKPRAPVGQLVAYFDKEKR
ncbi:hypothetical protein PsYK624_096090 [Phanerochaete sordida]|uniref:Uncharacterized protein n=1 Tax=Phanerochaete sordida TaxID=48140 RepID=A0A9P3GGU6_9APHY|nr:hypothetical protein PsYK624_096090 [Phanerochaete sordida]